jgi:hypothetical protein
MISFKKKLKILTVSIRAYPFIILAQFFFIFFYETQYELKSKLSDLKFVES